MSDAVSGDVGWFVGAASFVVGGVGLGAWRALVFYLGSTCKEHVLTGEADEALFQIIDL